MEILKKERQKEREGEREVKVEVERLSTLLLSRYRWVPRTVVTQGPPGSRTLKCMHTLSTVLHGPSRKHRGREYLLQPEEETQGEWKPVCVGRRETREGKA